MIEKKATAGTKGALKGFKSSIIVEMTVLHISEAEAARNFPALLARVRSGTEVVIENDLSAAVVLRVAPSAYFRRLSESLRMARLHGSTATLDSAFARDLESGIEGHSEPLENRWG